MLALLPVFLALIALEAAFGYFTGRARFGARDTASSLAMVAGNVVAGLALAGFVGAAYYLASRIAIFHIPLTWWGLALCFFAEDLAYYWFHRTAHAQRWFWASHVVHHSSQLYNLSTALRQTWTGNLSYPGSNTYMAGEFAQEVGGTPGEYDFFGMLSTVE